MASYSPEPVEKTDIAHLEDGGVTDYSKRGQAATDQYGQTLTHFDPAVEARIRRKIDFNIVPIVAALYLFCFIDRTNIGNARLAGIEKDLGLKGYDYNALLSIFYISYILFEIPSNIACKYFGPGKWLPFCTICFGILTIAFAFVKNKAEANAVRFLLGIFEAGLLPGIAYYLSRWYRKAELAFRLSLYIVTAPLAGAFGGLLASGILRIRSIGSVRTWEMIFLIEGIITTVIGIIAYFILTDRPETARWLTAEEKAIAIARVKSENVGSTEVLDKMDVPKIKRGILSPNTLTIGFIFLLNNITAAGIAFFAPTIVRTIFPTATVVRQQLLTVPPYIVGAAGVLIICWSSWKLDRRMLFIIALGLPVAVGYIMFLATNPTQARIRYGGLFVLTAGAFSYGALCNACVAVNVLSDTARSAGIGMNVMMGSVGALVSTWTYLPKDGPGFHIGNGLNLASAITISAVGSVLLVWQIADNKKRAQRDVAAELQGLSTKEVQDLDWKHPAFRWKH